MSTPSPGPVRPGPGTGPCVRIRGAHRCDSVTLRRSARYPPGTPSGACSGGGGAGGLGRRPGGRGGGGPRRGRATSPGGGRRRARAAGWIRRVATTVRISSTLAARAPVMPVTAL
ncbi:hypothetical protein E4K73_31720 [Streptomyces sp. IB201691-2A2]|nr:hypothetical protein E4K73_31720 [Streptomyces sp. IB201691-2A2]